MQGLLLSFDAEHDRCLFPFPLSPSFSPFVLTHVHKHTHTHARIQSFTQPHLLTSRVFSRAHFSWRKTQRWRCGIACIFIACIIKYQWPIEDRKLKLRTANAVERIQSCLEIRGVQTLVLASCHLRVWISRVVDSRLTLQRILSSRPSRKPNLGCCVGWNLERTRMKQVPETIENRYISIRNVSGYDAMIQKLYYLYCVCVCTCAYFFRNRILFRKN